jgi:uncharacterized membrane protein (UPF0127 family)
VSGPTVAKRLAALPEAEVCGVLVPVARGPLARLLGLALLERGEAGAGLLLPRCSSVHTFGMRFPLLIVFLDRGGAPLSIRHLRPGRFAQHRPAAAVLEIPA